MTDRTNQPAVEDLVRRAKSGCNEALGELFQQYESVAGAYCRATTRNAADARDLAQETFIRAFSRLDTIRDDDRFGPWLMGITRMVCKEWTRSISRRRKHTNAYANVVLQDEGNNDGRTPDNEESEHNRDALSNALADLDDDHRLAIHAFYSTGGGIERVCDVLSVSRATGYRLLTDARTKLRSLMHKQESVS